MIKNALFAHESSIDDMKTLENELSQISVIPP